VSDSTERSALATIAAFESTAFRIAQVARQFLAEHPDLPIFDINPRAYESVHGRSTPKLDITVGTPDDLRAWAEARGVTVDVAFYDSASSAHAFEAHKVAQTISGVEVVLGATRTPTEDELTAWRDQAAAAALVEASLSADRAV
jgi:hypothetical protein